MTNLDTNLQQVADNALATQIATLRNTFDPQCNNKSGCYPAATEGAVVVMSPQTGAVYAMSSYPSYNLSEWVGGLSAAQNAAALRTRQRRAHPQPRHPGAGTPRDPPSSSTRPPPPSRPG